MRTKPTTRHEHQTQPPIYRNLFNTVDILRSVRRFNNQPGKTTFFSPSRKIPIGIFTFLPLSLFLHHFFIILYAGTAETCCAY